jgi:sodium-dependent dicarboxylate transporter 2/3/5
MIDESSTPDMHTGFDLVRSRAGMVLAPAAFFAIWFAPLHSLPEAAHRLAAIMAAVIILWICETFALPVTALMGAAACVVLRVADDKQVFPLFADPLMFLFIGSFILAKAIFLHGLDRRVALGILSLNWVGARPSRILFAFGAVTAAASAWISNTAITAMMFAIGLSILQYLLRTDHGGPPVDRRYATGVMLMTAFSASIGGLATPVGTPPNVMGLGQLKTQLGISIPFFTWMMIGVPIVVVLYAFLFTYLNWLCPAGVKVLPQSHEVIASERRALGRWRVGEISTLVAFLVTVILWVTPGIVAIVCGTSSDAYVFLKKMLPESVSAVLGASLLFLLPGGNGRRAIAWREAAQIDWGIVLLYGGGVAFGSLASSTGLTAAIADSAREWLPGAGPFTMLAGATIFAALVSETTSNTASVTVVVPLVIALSLGLEVDPLVPTLGATMGCSLGFMLPVSTPCNAIVYGSGYIPISRMIRYGLILDVAGIIIIVGMLWAMSPLIHSMVH